MDETNQPQANQAGTYRGFMLLTKIAVLLVVLALILLAIFLL